jgi:hypothetical protein
MAELSRGIDTEHRLAVIETRIEYIIAGQKELKDLLKEHIEGPCAEKCNTTQDIKRVEADVKLYQKWTWATFVAILATAVRSFWP